jgi:hypothetical protein
VKSATKMQGTHNQARARAPPDCMCVAPLAGQSASRLVNLVAAATTIKASLRARGGEGEGNYLSLTLASPVLAGLSV